MAFWISTSEQVIRAEIDGPVMLDEPLVEFVGEVGAPAAC